MSSSVISYDSKRLVPAPFITINKQFQKSVNGDIVGSLFNITVNGKLVALRGSPSASGFVTNADNWSADNFWIVAGNPPDEFVGSIRLSQMQNKIESMRNAFSKSNEGRSFEIQPCNGVAPIKFNPRIIDINFDEGTWFDTVDYTITLEADLLYGPVVPSGEDSFNNIYLSDVTESWNLEDANQPMNEKQHHTYRLTHTLSAVGKKFYDEQGLVVKEAWEQAKDYVITRTGIDNSIIRDSGNLFLSSNLQGFNHVRSNNVDKSAGSYSTVETWLVLAASGGIGSSGNALEGFEISTDSTRDTAIKTVSIDGNIQGLESNIFPASTGDSDFLTRETKYVAASGKFSAIEPLLITRAQVYSNLILNTVPVSSRIGRNPVLGTINYSFQYDTRPSTCIPGALSEIITISDTNSNDVFAIIPVLGRQAGPVLQNINTITETRRQISVELVMPTSSGCANTVDGVTTLLNASPKSKVNKIILAFEGHLDANYAQVFKASDTNSWNPIEGAFTRNVEFVYQ